MSDKRVLVLGLGKSGEAACRLLLRQKAQVIACDLSSGPAQLAAAEKLKSIGVSEVKLGIESLDSPAFDLAVISPGVFPSWNVVQQVLDHGIPMISELELGYRFCKCPIIAVTGTNGKTTTTELITEVLKAGGRKVKAAGNIGFPLCDASAGSEDLDALVVEVSSYQLERVEAFRPFIAVYLNLTPDHFDRYPNLEEYGKAKLRIFEKQTELDFAVLTDTALKQWKPYGWNHGKARLVKINTDESPAEFWRKGTTIQARFGSYEGLLLDQQHTGLQGIHNAENVMAALAVASILELNPQVAIEAVQNFSLAPHRCELVRVRNGVRFVNDSKATNLDAVVKALIAQPGRVVLIAGGKDKGLDFSELNPEIKKFVKHAVLIGEVRERMKQQWQGLVSCEFGDSMNDAVQKAAQKAHAGDTVLLSPACSSFDMFANYEARGNEFKKAVLALSDP